MITSKSSTLKNLVCYSVHSPAWSADIHYRVYQYKEQLLQHNINLSIIPFSSYLLRRVMYRSGHMLIKMAAVLESLLRWLPAIQRADGILIQREALPFGPPIIERYLAQSKPLIYDFDDAIWIQSHSRANGRLARWLRPATKTQQLLQLSQLAFAGNPFLATYARQYASQVEVVPTTVDCSHYTPVTKSNALPVVGWIGSHSTTAYLETIMPALQEVAHTDMFKLYIVGADRHFELPGIACVNLPWSRLREIHDFQTLDIGLYPIPETEWALGKCAFKAIQYGAVGIPTICSPVGFNTTVVQHQATGLYASDHAEWVTALRTLVRTPALRAASGAAARQHIATHFNAQIYGNHIATRISNIVSKGLM